MASLPASMIASASALSMTQPFAEITDKRETVHGLYGSKLFLSLVVFSSTGCVSQEDPVGGFITGTFEFFGINKGLQPENRVIVTSLPVRRNSSGTSAQQVRGQMWDLNPWQNEKTGIIGKQVTIFL